MKIPLHHHAKHLVRGILFALLIAAAIIGVVLAFFLLLYGFGRFKADFWPLDNSRVGPNIVASFVLAVLVIGHNEYRTALKDFERGDTVRTTIKEMEQEVLHPVEAGEESVAEDVAALEENEQSG